jgi:hypothetical protein
VKPCLQLGQVSFQNTAGNKLVGIFTDAGSQDVVILCHGYACSKVSQRLAYCCYEHVCMRCSSPLSCMQDGFRFPALAKVWSSVSPKSCSVNFDHRSQLLTNSRNQHLLHVDCSILCGCMLGCRPWLRRNCPGGPFRKRPSSRSHHQYISQRKLNTNITMVAACAVCVLTSLGMVNQVCDAVCSKQSHFCVACHMPELTGQHLGG